MAISSLKRVSGHITVVQEQRFRLTTDAGQSVLFTLANDAGVGSADLRRWHERGTRVAVEYDGEPNLASGVALSVHAT